MLAEDTRFLGQRQKTSLLPAIAVATISASPCARYLSLIPTGQSEEGQVTPTQAVATLQERNPKFREPKPFMMGSNPA